MSQCLTQRLWPFFEEVDFQTVLQNAVFEKYESFNLLLWVKAQRPQISLSVVPLVFFGMIVHCSTVWPKYLQ